MGYNTHRYIWNKYNIIYNQPLLTIVYPGILYTLNYQPVDDRQQRS